VNADATATATQDSGIEQGAAPEADATAGTDAASSQPLATDTPYTEALPEDGVTDGVTDGVGGVTDGVGGVTDGAGGVTDGLGSVTDGNLLNVNVDLNGDANLAAPVNGAVAANANVAAPIDAAVAANIGTVDSDAVAISQQDAIINQQIDGSAEATSDQTSDITQPDGP
jgi:hypothetical protein